MLIAAGCFVLFLLFLFWLGVRENGNVGDQCVPGVIVLLSPPLLW